MAEGAWSHTASVLAMLHNVNRDPKKGDPAKPDDFNPYRAQRPPSKPLPVIGEKNFDLLKMVFVDQKGM